MRYRRKSGFRRRSSRYAKRRRTSSYRRKYKRSSYGRRRRVAKRYKRYRTKRQYARNPPIYYHDIVSGFERNSTTDVANGIHQKWTLFDQQGPFNYNDLVHIFDKIIAAFPALDQPTVVMDTVDKDERVNISNVA